MPANITSASRDRAVTAISIESDRSPVKAPKPDSKSARSGILAVFASTFFTIFLAEMGDKTQLATLLMAAESQAPWVVFAGAGTALVATSLVGVLIGCWLSSKLSPKTLDSIAGVMLSIVAISLFWDVAQF